MRDDADLKIVRGKDAERRTKLHIIKTEEVYFDAIATERKTFEIRENDRNYQRGDIVIFVCGTDDSAIKFERGQLWTMAWIKYVLRGEEAERFGVEKGKCVFGFNPMAAKYAQGDMGAFLGGE